MKLTQYGDHLTQLESNIRIAQKKAQEQADSEFLDVGEEGYEDEYMLESTMDLPEPPDRPGEDEWDPEFETPVRPKKSRKSSNMTPLTGPPSGVKPKGKRGRPAKNKG